MEKIGNTILAIKEIIKENNISLSEAGIPKKPIKKFISFLKEVKDARLPSKVEFPLHEVILVTFLAIMAGAGTIADIADFAEMKHQWLKNISISRMVSHHMTPLEEFCHSSIQHCFNLQPLHFYWIISK